MFPSLSAMAIGISIAAIASSLFLTFSIVKSGKIKSYEYGFLALQFCNVLSQTLVIIAEMSTNEMISYEWMQLLSLLNNVGITLININILSIFSVLDYRITLERLQKIRIAVVILCFVFLLPQSTQSIWIFYNLNSTMGTIAIISCTIWYAMAVIHDNWQMSFLLYLIYQREKELIKKEHLYCTGILISTYSG